MTGKRNLRVISGIVAAALLAPAAALSAEPKKAGAASDDSPSDGAPSKTQAPPKPLCRVEITNQQGFSLKGLLLAFEKGVYRVRAGEGAEHSLAEAELKSVRFAPLGEPAEKSKVAKRPKKPREQPEPRDAKASWLQRLAEKRKAQMSRLKQLHKSGRLEGHVQGLKSRLRGVGNVIEAAAILSDLNMAQRLQTRQPLSPEQARKLIDSIEARHVRQSAEDILRMLRRMARPAGPGKPGGERPPPRRNWR